MMTSFTMGNYVVSHVTTKHRDSLVVDIFHNDWKHSSNELLRGAISMDVEKIEQDYHKTLRQLLPKKDIVQVNWELI